MLRYWAVDCDAFAIFYFEVATFVSLSVWRACASAVSTYSQTDLGSTRQKPLFAMRSKLHTVYASVVLALLQHQVSDYHINGEHTSCNSVSIITLFLIFTSSEASPRSLAKMRMNTVAIAFELLCRTYQTIRTSRPICRPGSTIFQLALFLVTWSRPRLRE